MPVELLWSPQARQDMLDIYLTIGIDNSDAAERVYSKIQEKAELLQVHPRLGVRRPEIRPSARILIQGPYLLLYEIRPDADEGAVRSVEVVRIVDGRRNLIRPF